MKIRNVNPKFQYNYYEPGCCYQEWKTSGGPAVRGRRSRIGAAITCLFTPFAKDSFGRQKSDSIHWRHLTQGILEGNGKESIWSTRSHRLVNSVDATPILRHHIKKGARRLPLSSAAYADFSSFNFAVRAGKTSL